MELVRPASGVSISRLISVLTNAEPTYSEVGASLRGEQPQGYRHDEYEANLGAGRTTFQIASVGLQTWRAHGIPGIDVLPHGTSIRPGATVLVTFGTPLLALAAPCRVVGVIDRPDRWGFAYGTLPGHPEQGEEAFVVSVDGTGSVNFKITAFSRPGERITRLLGPIGRALQTVGTNGYLKALRRFVDQSD